MSRKEASRFVCWRDHDAQEGGRGRGACALAHSRGHFYLVLEDEVAVLMVVLVVVLGWSRESICGPLYLGLKLLTCSL